MNAAVPPTVNRAPALTLDRQGADRGGIEDRYPLRSLQARDLYLATEITASTREHRGASVVSLFGPAPAADSVISAPTSSQASLHAIIAKEYCLYGCGLVYIPMLPGTLDDPTLEILLDSLVSWLRPRGELIVCALMTMPDATFRDAAVVGYPGVKTPEGLLRLAVHIDGATARLHQDPQDNLAYLHLRHH